MVAKQRIKPPENLSEVLAFPEKPTLKDLISADAPAPAFCLVKEEEEKSEMTSPLFNFQSEPNGYETDPIQQSVSKNETISPPLVLSNEPEMNGSDIDPPLDSTNSFKHNKENGEPAHAIIHHKFTPTAPEYRHFIRLAEIRRPPKVDLQIARLTCLIAISSCAFIGLVCCVIIMTLLLI